MNVLEKKKSFADLPNELIAKILNYSQHNIIDLITLLSLFKTDVSQRNKNIFKYMFPKRTIVIVTEKYSSKENDCPSNRAEKLLYIGISITSFTDSIDIFKKYEEEKIYYFDILSSMLKLFDSLEIMRCIKFFYIDSIEPYSSINCFNNVEILCIDIKPRLCSFDFTELNNNFNIHIPFGITVNTVNASFVMPAGIIPSGQKRFIIAEKGGIKKIKLKNLPKLVYLSISSSKSKTKLEKFIIDIGKNTIKCLIVDNVEEVDFRNTILPELKFIKIENSYQFLNPKIIEKIKTVEKIFLMYPFPNDFSFIDKLPNLKDMVFDESFLLKSNIEDNIKEKIKKDREFSMNELEKFSKKRKRTFVQNVDEPLTKKKKNI